MTCPSTSEARLLELKLVEVEAIVVYYKLLGAASYSFFVGGEDAVPTYSELHFASGKEFV